jgi:Amidohydrolase family
LEFGTWARRCRPRRSRASRKVSSRPPRIYAVGTVLGGWNEDLGIGISTPEEGRRAVRELQAGGSDFIKIYTLLPRNLFFAVADEARTRHIAVVGYVPLTVPLAEAAAAGLKSFEHGYGLREACSTYESDVRRRIELAPSGAPNSAAAWGKIVQATDRAYGEQARDGGYSEAKCAHFADALASYGTWQCPTLAVRQAFALLNDPLFINDPRMKYIPGAVRQRWAATLTADARSAGIDAAGFADRRARLQQESRMAVTLFRKGVRLLAGTDCGNPYLVAGFSVHDELALLVEAGLSPLEALASATSKPAQFLGTEKESGAVEPGMRADLVLLNRDPLADIRNTRSIEAVILDGHLYNRLALDRMLSKVEAAEAR